VTNYYNPFPDPHDLTSGKKPNSCSAVFRAVLLARYDDGTIALIDNWRKRLNKIISTSVDAVGSSVHYVDLTKAFTSIHRICAKKAWIFPVKSVTSPGFKPFHPNPVGQRAIADQIAGAVRAQRSGQLIFDSTSAQGQPRGIFTAKADGSAITQVPGTGGSTSGDAGYDDNGANWAGDHRHFIFSRLFTDSTGQLVTEGILTDVDGQSATGISLPDGFSFGRETFQLSADGRWVAFDRSAGCGTCMWIEHPDGSELHEVWVDGCTSPNSSPPGVSYSAFTPDSTRIVFMYRCDNMQVIASEPAAGGASTDIVEAANGLGVSDVSPDGRTILFAGESALQTIPITGGTPTIIENGGDFRFARYSPDGSSIAFIEVDPSVCPLDSDGGPVMEASATGGAASTVIPATRCATHLDW
jgi:hypothetical protein